MSSSYLARVNRTRVPVRLLMEMVERHAEMEPERRGVFEARAFEMFELLKEQRFSDQRVADLTVAINFRLEALARLVVGDATKGWTIAGRPDGATMLHADLLKAAAIEPLIETEQRASFDPDSFMRRVLGITEARGRA